jgi:tetratricopeptide (TPR) repeat protein
MVQAIITFVAANIPESTMTARLISNDESKKSTTSLRMHIAAAQMAYQKGLYSTALRNYNFAMMSAEQLGLQDEDLSDGLLGLAKCNCELGNYSRAETLYKRVLGIDQSTLSASCTELAIDLNDLARLYLKTSRFDAAEELLVKAEALLTDSDPHALELAAVKKNRAYICCQRDNLKEAAVLVKDAQLICDTTSGRQTKVYAEVLVVLALVEAKKGCYDQSESLIEKAIASFELLTGGQHPELADFLDIAANLFSMDHVQAKAEQLTARAKEIRKHVREMDH